MTIQEIALFLIGSLLLISLLGLWLMFNFSTRYSRTGVARSYALVSNNYKYRLGVLVAVVVVVVVVQDK